jgi:hypothetical protein
MSNKSSSQESELCAEFGLVCSPEQNTAGEQNDYSDPTRSHMKLLEV